MSPNPTPTDIAARLRTYCESGFPDDLIHWVVEVRMAMRKAASELDRLRALSAAVEALDWSVLAKALFVYEGPSAPDGAWFDYQHKAKRLLQLASEQHVALDTVTSDCEESERRVVAVRSSRDVHGFEACVNAELNAIRATSEGMTRFTAEELNVRRVQCDAARAVWNGPYPWRQCSRCYAQIHVGDQTVCDLCLDFAGESGRVTSEGTGETRNDVVEECAKVAERACETAQSPYAVGMAHGIAIAIRALATGERKA